MPPLTESQFQEIAATLLARVRAAAPEWTGADESDPGITLLQLFAFVTESLLYRQNRIPPRGAGVARLLARAAGELAEGKASRADNGLRRVNYFDGQLLSSKDFTDEQDYFRARLRRGNRLLAGSGIVSGLVVSVAAGTGGQGQSVVVQPGFALDPRGEEIEVCEPAAMTLPARGQQLFAQLLFAEKLTEPVAASTVSPEGEQRFARVEETFTLLVEPDVRTDAVAIARLTSTRGRWRLDPRFKPPRVRT